MNSNKFLARFSAIVTLLALVSLTGCRNPENDNNMEMAAMSSTSQGSSGTGMGVHGVQTRGDAPTGSSTQRTSTGYTGPVGAPGPGQAGR